MPVRRSFFKYIASLLIFGLNGIVASGIALNSYEIVLTRSLLGSMVLALVFLLSRRRPPFPENRNHMLYLTISGIAMGASWMFLYEAYQQIGVGIATLANYCGPVIVMILSPILFREKVTRAKAFGFLAVLTGMVCINSEALSDGEPGWGIICGIMSAVTYALMIIFNKKARSITGLENSMWQLIAGALTVAVFVGIRQGYAMHIDPGSILPILILGGVNTGAGCYLYFSSLGALPVQTVSICGYLEPLSAVLFSVVILGETMSAVQILGGAAFGELLTDNRKRIYHP
jgi:drug/metabolite transporter (DMT)-like permease